MGNWELLLHEVFLMFYYPVYPCIPPRPNTDSPPMKGYFVGVCNFFYCNFSVDW